MGEYKKLTKEDVDFPKYCLFFIKKIAQGLEEKEFNERGLLELNIESIYPYCSEAFDLVSKTFEHKGYNVMTPTFRLVYKYNTKYYIYKWKFRKVDVDDLPF